MGILGPDLIRQPVATALVVVLVGVGGVAIVGVAIVGAVGQLPDAAVRRRRFPDKVWPHRILV